MINSYIVVHLEDKNGMKGLMTCDLHELIEVVADLTEDGYTVLYTETVEEDD